LQIPSALAAPKTFMVVFLPLGAPVIFQFEKPTLIQINACRASALQNCFYLKLLGPSTEILQEEIMKVKDVMHKGATCVDLSTPVLEIAKRMRKDDVGALPVRSLQGGG
jgi:CBS domain-containing protein